MKKPVPRPQPAPLSYGASAMRTEGIWRAVKNFLAFSERGNVNPMSTKEVPRTAVTTRRRISDRQVEIMTTVLCDVIANCRIQADVAPVAMPALIRAMVTQVSRLNEEVASHGATPEVEMGIDELGRPVVIASEATLGEFRSPVESNSR